VKSGTEVVLDPATGAVLPIGASHLRPVKSGTAVVLDPATGAVLRIRRNGR
jgi:cell division protein FtsI/penicillin-binding protein 2